MNYSKSELEARRLQAEALFRSGTKPADIARRLNVSRTTTSRWYRRMLTPEGMKAKVSGGRPRKMALGNMRAIYVLRTDWTWKSFSDAIYDRIRVRYSAEHAGRLLRILRKADAEIARPPQGETAGHDGVVKTGRNGRGNSQLK